MNFGIFWTKRDVGDKELSIRRSSTVIEAMKRLFFLHFLT